MEFLAGKPRPGQSAYASPPKNPFDIRSDRWRLDMNDEITLGLAPANWSTTSQMSDPRPNGQNIFDARFRHSPMGRARANDGIIWDPRALVSPLGTRKQIGAPSVDSRWFAESMKDETAAAAISAEKFKLQPNDVRDAPTGEITRVQMGASGHMHSMGKSLL